VVNLRLAWPALTFADPEKDATRPDAVAKAARGEAAEEKARTQKTDDGAVCHSLRTLLVHLGTLTRSTIALPVQGSVTFERLTEPTPLQRRAFELLGASIPLRFR
jgi:hypothetical protein